MGRRGITILDEHIANKIAAGEVIERPASVVKELVENALDAGARRIEIEVRQGGKEYIRVTDDGAGMAPDQVPLAFARHATSKIHSADDLFNVHTLGFRGEALPSIAAVAEVELRTRTADAPGGVRFTMEAGRPGRLEPVGTPVGTAIVVRRLFFNTPARYKFLRSEAAERRRVADIVSRMALAWPAIGFRLIVDGRQMFATPGDGDLVGAIRAIYGAAMAAATVPVDDELDGLRVHGRVGKPSVFHGNRDRMSVFLNGRWIQSAAITRAIEQGYETLLPPRRYPLAVIHLSVDPAAVDVNVHPAKAEVRFKDDRAVFRAVLRAVRGGLMDGNLVGSLGTARTVDNTRLPAGGAGTDRVVDFGEPTAGAVGTFRTSELPFASRSTDVEQRHPVSDYGYRHAFGETAAAEASPAWPTPPMSASRERRGGSSVDVGCRHRYVTDSSARSASAATDSPDRSPGAAADDPRQILRDMRIIGQLHRTFIVGETALGLWIVDQHVAHERILYERFLERGAAGRGAVQQLLIPATVTMSPDRVGLVEQFQDELHRLGFVLEPFGGASYIVRGVPVELSGASEEARLTALLEELVDACERDGKWSPHAAAASLACRAAIKAGQPLDTARMKKLVVELAGADNPFACPHGRPIVIELGRADLERRFGRR